MLKTSSLYDLTSNYNKHIAPFFSNKKLIKISKNDCIDFFNYLNTCNYAYKTKKKIRLYVSSILNFAVKYYDLPYNVILKLDGFRNTEIKKEMQIWSKNEFQAFISTIDDIIYKCLFDLLYFTGCRKGEALALTWQDIDFKENILNINKSLTRKCKGSTYIITTPKNASSVRKIIIPDLLKKELLELKELSNSEMIFAENNIPLAENTISRKFKKHCALASVKEIRIHDLRHSHASLLINQGESIVLVAKRLGHTNIEQTLNTYSHLMPSEEKQMVERLNSLWQEENK